MKPDRRVRAPAARAVAALALLVAGASAAAAATTSCGPAPRPAPPPPPPPSTPPPPPPPPSLAGTFAGQARQAITLTTPRAVPEQTSESPGSVDVTEPSPGHLRLAVHVNPEGEPCALEATGERNNWTIAGEQTCTGQQDNVTITLAVTNGTAVFDLPRATVDFTANLTIATGHGRRASTRTGTIVYHLEAQRGEAGGAGASEAGGTSGGESSPTTTTSAGAGHDGGTTAHDGSAAAPGASADGGHAATHRASGAHDGGR